jgi:hypothetical protein
MTGSAALVATGPPERPGEMTPTGRTPWRRGSWARPSNRPAAATRMRPARTAATPDSQAVDNSRGSGTTVGGCSHRQMTSCQSVRGVCGMSVEVSDVDTVVTGCTGCRQPPPGGIDGGSRSHAMIPAACWRRRRPPGRGRPSWRGVRPVTAQSGPDRGCRDPTPRCTSSPWMRWSPQRGFSVAKRTISCCTFSASGGRPVWRCGEVQPPVPAQR